jgi:hypothetical protein
VAPAAKPTDFRRCACALSEMAPIAANTNALLTTMRFIMNVLLSYAEMMFRTCSEQPL